MAKTLLQVRRRIRTLLKLPEQEAFAAIEDLLQDFPKSGWPALRSTPEGRSFMGRVQVHYDWLVSEVDRLVRFAGKETIGACKLLEHEWCKRIVCAGSFPGIQMMQVYYAVKKQRRASVAQALVAAAQQKQSVLLREWEPGLGMRLLMETFGEEVVSMLCVRGLAQMSAKDQAKAWKAVLDTPVFSVVIVRVEEDLRNPALMSKMVHLNVET